jgi:hypothetical protein
MLVSVELTQTAKGDLAMFIPVMFGLYFALLGMIAWDDYQAAP